MTITEYIRSNEKLREMDYMTVYSTIIELISDGHMTWLSYAGV